MPRRPSLDDQHRPDDGVSHVSWGPQRIAISVDKLVQSEDKELLQAVRPDFPGWRKSA
jgi:hypothetical protein